MDTLWDWLQQDEVLAETFARARIAQAHSLAERAIRVSRNAYGKDTAGVQAARLEVDTLKWYTSKLAPRLYGERLTVEDTGSKTVRVVFENAGPGLPHAIGNRTAIARATHETVEAEAEVESHP